MKSEVIVGDNRLQMTRIFDAPPALVFAFWNQVDRLEQWWGCKETASANCTIDFRVGGSFVCVMQLSTGEFTYTGIYDEIVEPEKIAWHADFGPTTTRVVVEFIDLQNARTKLVLTQVGFPNHALCENVSRGTNDSFDKLDSLLARVLV
ncbi:MAG: SRPBCC domain-containing protein [Terriglobales bacterium]|jgi:uncharacterized protein YndB with AHSA1/START domain